MALRSESLLLDLPLALAWGRRTRRWRGTTSRVFVVRLALALAWSQRTRRSGTTGRVFVVRLAPGPAVESENAEEEWHYE